MQVKNLPVKRFSEGHKKAASSKLTVVHNDNSLEHVVVKPFRHAIKSPDIAVERADNVKVASRTKVRCKCQISSIVANGR